MNPSDHPEIIPAPTQFAAGTVADGHDLKWRITACFRCRIPELQGIHITVIGNTVALRGKVRSSHEKRLCLECCRHIPGVIRVVDDLTVPERTPMYFEPGEECP